MPLGLLLLIVGSAMGYLSVIDRSSAIALYVVELESAAGGLPIWGLLMAAGGALVLRAVMTSRKPEPSTADRISQYNRRQAAASPGGATGAAAPAAGGGDPGDWQADVFNQARALALESGGRIQLGQPPAPIQLLLERSTVERARRNLDAFARFLATAPLPPRTRVIFKSCPAPPTPWSKLAEGVFKRHFAAGSFKVVSRHEELDIIFSEPDPRWSR